MAEYFVAADAAGGGDGSEGNPWTWDEMATASPTFVYNTTVTVGPGTHSATVRFMGAEGAAGITVRGSYEAARPVVQFDPAAPWAFANNLNNSLLLIENLEVLVPGGGLFSNSVAFSPTLRGVKSDGDVVSHVDRPVSFDRCEILGTVHDNQHDIIDSFINSNVQSKSYGNYSRSVFGGNHIRVGRQKASNLLTHGRLTFDGRTTSHATAVSCIVYGHATPVVIDDLTRSPRAEARGCIFIQCGPLPVSDDIRYIDCIETDDDPFLDATNHDYRLTAAAKAAAYAPQLKAIMASLSNVPGITVDPLDELFGASGFPLSRAVN